MADKVVRPTKSVFFFKVKSFVKLKKKFYVFDIKSILKINNTVHKLIVHYNTWREK